jgi:hypothetical protein
VTAATGLNDITPYINYVSIDTTSIVDGQYGDASNDCSSGMKCLKMHNGGIAYWWNGDAFCNTTSLNYVQVFFDPDGRYSGSTTGAGKAVHFALYYDGKVRTAATRENNSVTGSASSCNAPESPAPGTDPPWFSW